MKRAIVLLCAFVFLAACGGSSKPAATGQTQTAESILSGATAALSNVKSFHFHLTHENGTTPMPLNLQLVDAEGDVVVPDKLAADVKAKAGPVSVSVKVIGIGDLTWITNPFTRKWQQLPDASVKDVANPTALVQSILAGVSEAKLESQGDIDGVKAYRLTGKVDSGALQAAIPTAETGLPVSVEVWIGVSDSFARRARITGPVAKGEPDNIVRQIDLTKYNAGIDIQPPPSE